ncbi:MAG: tol-pal system protein YbgF [Gammaproteobacteria bacterium HGW-Gammaproteobacteria-11]|nr:MAG: tol-pal system protein YbgF [Gammaproteobacteria bacterium HGW-Gammaproteobacteria-11]
MKGLRALTTSIFLLLPLAATAQVPVYEGSGGGAPVVQNQLPVTQTGAGLSMEGQLMQQLYQLQQEVSMLRGLVEEQDHRLKTMERDQLERYQDLDRRLQSGSVATSQSTTPEPAAGNNAEPTQTDSSASGNGNAPVAADPEREKLMYDAAFDLVRQRDFDTAIQAFTAFVRRYPQSDYAGNAQYWLGEIHLVQSDLEAAGRAFALVISQYPGHRKEADALYKLADVERRLGNNDKARQLYNEVLSKHPDTSAAQLARRDLDSLS